MVTPVRILYVGDNLHDRQLVKDALIKEHKNFFVIEAGNRENFEKELISGDFNLILSDFNILGFEGLEILQYTLDKKPGIPIIIVTGKGSEDIAIQALNMGAADYVTKSESNIKELPIVIHKVFQNIRLQTEHKLALSARYESEVMFRSIYESANIAILLSSPDGRIYSANESACRLFDMTEKEICAAGRNKLVDPADPRLQQLLDERERTGKAKGELTLIKKSGTKFSVEVSSVIFTNSEGDVRTSMIISDLTDQKLVEEAIHKDRALLRTLIDNLPHAVYVKDKEGRKLITNAADLKLMHLNSESEVIGKTDQEIFNSDEGKRGFNEDMTVMQSGKPLINHEDTYIDEVGKQHWRLISKFPLYNSEKKITGLVGFGQDITDRKIAEQDLTWEQYLMLSLLDNIPDAIYFKDKESKFIRINKALSDRFMLNDPLKAIGYTDSDFFGQEHAIDAISDEQEIIRTGKPLINKEEMEVWLDKPPTWVLTTKMPLKNINGEIIGTFGISRDITELKKSEEQLMVAKDNAEENERQFRSLFENMIEGFAYCKLIFEDSIPVDYIYLDVNNAFESLTGFKNVAGKKVTDVIPGIRQSDPKLFEIYNRVSQTGQSERFETFVKGMNDWYSISVYSPRKEYFVTVFDVITERKKAEEELIKARERAEESDKLKTAFLHNITHEIRTPMNAIIGFSGCLLDEKLDIDRRNYFIDIIIKSSHQLLSIINDIVNLATLEANQEKIIEKDVDVNLIYRLVYNQFVREADEKNISLVYSLPLPDGKAIIYTDETKFIKVLSNLLNNALKFTKQGIVTFGYSLKEGNLEFFVQDTGIGIAPHMHEKIFERFMQVENSLTREYGGSGLGLSIAKAYVEYLGGRIYLSSELEKGSTFYFTIPGKKEAEQVDIIKIVSKAENIDFSKKITILIAEDEQPNYLFLMEVLSDLNCNILWAENGLQAVEICKINEHIDLVLMDLRMPLMNGFEATKQIKILSPNMPIIAQTSYSSDLDMQKAFLYGCNDFITKPINSELLLSKINSLLVKKPFQNGK